MRVEIHKSCFQRLNLLSLHFWSDGPTLLSSLTLDSAISCEMHGAFLLHKGRFPMVSFLGDKVLNRFLVFYSGRTRFIIDPLTSGYVPMLPRKFEFRGKETFPSMLRVDVHKSFQEFLLYWPPCWTQGGSIALLIPMLGINDIPTMIRHRQLKYQSSATGVPLVPVFLLVLLVFSIDAACAFRAEEMPLLISCRMVAKVMAGVSDVDVILGSFLST
ncbi:hypothetical protein Tco_0855937 [Tanacetum coccineum]